MLKMVDESAQKPSEDSMKGSAMSKDSRDSILSLLDENDPIKKMLNLALILEDQGHPQRAQVTYEEVVKGRKTDNQNDEDQVLLFCETKLSSILREHGQYTKAKELCQHALDSKIQSTEATRNLKLLTRGEMALILRDQGRSEDAYEVINGTLEEEKCSPYQDMLHGHLVNVLASILGYRRF